MLMSIPVGAALWLASAVLAGGVARIIPPGRPPLFRGELLLAIVAGAALGLTATVLDFGGWNEPDWRAALLILFGALAAIGSLRAMRAAIPTAV